MVKLDKIKLTEINPAEYNPRVISPEEYKKLSRSINEYGLVDPILINLKNNTIIGGHQRYDVLLEEYNKTQDKIYEDLLVLSRGDIGWVFLDEELNITDENHERGLNIALNRISGDWDIPKLRDLLEDLVANDFELSLTGFDSLDLSELENNLDDLDLEEENKEDLGGSNGFNLIVIFDTPSEQEELYEELLERGFKCVMH